MGFSFVRTLRTQTSERFLLQSDTASDVAMLDAHYLVDGSVVGSLVIMDDTLVSPETVQLMLESIDERLFPAASLNDKTLSFSVFHGTPIGQFENENQR